MATSPKTEPAHALGAIGKGTRERPWVLKTPSGQSEFTAYRDDSVDPPALVVQVGVLGLAEVEHDAKSNRMRGR